MMRPTFCPVVAIAAAAAITLQPAFTLAADTGTANCTLITQAAADGITARIQADNHDIAAPQSVTTLSCLDGFFRGAGLNVITDVLNPTNLIASVEGRICNMATQAWSSMIGSLQCGLTVTGFDLGFGGFGGGAFCPKLSFGGGGPPMGHGRAPAWASAGGGGIVVNGCEPCVPTGYTVPPNAGAY